MALPKLLIRFLPPAILLLSGGLFYSAYQQIQLTERQAYQESKRNLQIAEEIVDSQLNSAISKLYMLANVQGQQAIYELGQAILDKHIAYTDIMLVARDGSGYLSINDRKHHPMPNADLSWLAVNQLTQPFWLSSIYQTHAGRWAFALKYQNDQHKDSDIWVQFDLQFTASRLESLKTLSNGYLFIVEEKSGLVVIHPDSTRIGTRSVSYQSGVADRVAKGESAGQHEYYYKSQFKVTEFDLNEQTGWVYVSGTDRQEILAASYQFTLAGIVLLVLVLSGTARSYLLSQLNQELKMLSTQRDLNGFKQALKSLFDRFVYHQGLAFCIYDSHHHQFQSLDYHGNLLNVIQDKGLAAKLRRRPIRFLTPSSADKVARAQKLTRRHYVIPLSGSESLLGVIYLQTTLPLPYTLLCTIQRYCEVSLCNLFLEQKLKSKDVMTQLDNKLTIREKINEHLTLPHAYFALLDIDHFKHINDVHGHQCGDKVIIQTAQLMERCFPKPGTISLARYGGEEFCILFTANNEHDAYDQCELLRQRIEQSPLLIKEQSVPYTVSIGITQIRDSQHITIGRADKALYQAKGLGRNQVVLNTFK
ncbi:diguanylate cyclase [Vibrio astriarenae]|uniref:diguanylate cyclase n=1 Tax=Vibrio astriarenae TaxID=1481923 RepID=A0A7Z2YGA6_9VIBR|nr:sensor domain-containing diguanylate cyclase [Vibrio astriarenae]QIA65945.1 diguanylate cyclase [Vibrio astriarenae]